MDLVTLALAPPVAVSFLVALQNLWAWRRLAGIRGALRARAAVGGGRSGWRFLPGPGPWAEWPVPEGTARVDIRLAASGPPTARFRVPRTATVPDVAGLPGLLLPLGSRLWYRERLAASALSPAWLERRLAALRVGP